MRVAVLGAGAVGSRVARQLLAADSVDQVLLRDVSSERLARSAGSIGDRVVIEHHPFPATIDADAVVVASPRGDTVVGSRAGDLSRPTGRARL